MFDHTASPRIAVIGSGPTGLYTLKGLVEASLPLAITVFEANGEPGRGTPYHPAINDPAMLANIASIEIPAITETLVDWLNRQPDQVLEARGIAREAIDERAFYPRLVLGDYFRDQFVRLVALGEARGHRIEVRERHRVLDIALQRDDIRLSVRNGSSVEAKDFLFDHVVMATGHNFPEKTETRPGFFVSPWPAAALSSIRNCRVGVLGTSLSAIDAVMTVATNHGTFYYDAAGELQYQPGAEADAFHAAMMSRKGLLPEADFYCPLPYLPPRVLTEAAIDALIATGRHDLLDEVFELFRAEIAAADPDYAAKIGLAALDLESFAEAYYAERRAADPFVWAARNLAEVRQNHDLRRTVPWRYAILQVHEVVAKVVPHLDERDLERFHRHFKSIFVDDYAAVPPQSIERLLALHRAGKLSVKALGSDYEISTRRVPRGALLKCDGRETYFEAFIDATGQNSLAAGDLPFPSLVRTGAVTEAATPKRKPLVITQSGVEDHATMTRTGGIDVDDCFRPVFTGGMSNQLYCAAISFLLHKLPFVQGITSAAEIGETVSGAILQAAHRTRQPDLPMSA